MTLTEGRLCVVRGSHPKGSRNGAEAPAPRYTDSTELTDLAARIRVLSEALRVAALHAEDVDANARSEMVDAARRLLNHVEVVLG